MQCNSQVFFYLSYMKFHSLGVSFSFIHFISFLFLLIFLGVGFGARLGSQRAHGVTYGLIVGVDSWKVFQDALKELWILHNIVVLFILDTRNV